jgi:hypothetical protein
MCALTVPQAALAHLHARTEGRRRLLTAVGAALGDEGGLESAASLSGDYGTSERGGSSLTGDDAAWLRGDSLLGRLLDRYLEPPGSERDSRVQRLCEQRTDAPLLLFFGGRFHRHLLKVRQDLLHAALETLIPPPTQPGATVEFYHWEEVSSHSLGRLVSALRIEGHYQATSRTETCCKMATWLLHRETQALVLTHGLSHSTEMGVLRVLPRLEFADVAPRISALLGAAQKQQSSLDDLLPLTPAEAESGGDASSTVNARFAALCTNRAPTPQNEVQTRQIEQLVYGLGRADNSQMSMRVLSSRARLRRPTCLRPLR